MSVRDVELFWFPFLQCGLLFVTLSYVTEYMVAPHRLVGQVLLYSVLCNYQSLLMSFTDQSSSEFFANQHEGTCLNTSEIYILYISEIYILSLEFWIISILMRNAFISARSDNKSESNHNACIVNFGDQPVLGAYL